MALVKKVTFAKRAGVSASSITYAVSKGLLDIFYVQPRNDTDAVTGQTVVFKGGEYIDSDAEKSKLYIKKHKK